MKNLLAASLIAFVLLSCNQQEDKASNPQSASMVAEQGAETTMEWIDSSKNLGRINEGQKVEIAFRFKNTGNKPLVIHSVRPGCGCTVADYPKEPIAPGKEGQITGSFDSQGRQGLQHKEIYVSANTSGNIDHRISFDVEVIPTKQN